jgi:hypothetical protein
MNLTTCAPRVESGVFRTMSIFLSDSPFYKIFDLFLLLFLCSIKLLIQDTASDTKTHQNSGVEDLNQRNRRLRNSTTISASTQEEVEVLGNSLPPSTIPTSHTHLNHQPSSCLSEVCRLSPARTSAPMSLKAQPIKDTNSVSTNITPGSSAPEPVDF